ncbi:hypothetical protein SAMN05216360_10766 [Methylobacterium phyllostachyos]|uniref:Uncharacterized protein n=1 Tax=Methylobacterium phyllostachyos TaxID=582672 RepID=A0A1H0A4D7_9HYPH|nr:hypothetical protein SAMN05216360_10766 [Methylobacterium phyllostachyos]
MVFPVGAASACGGLVPHLVTAAGTGDEFGVDGFRASRRPGLETRFLVTFVAAERGSVAAAARAQGLTATSVAHPRRGPRPEGRLLGPVARGADGGPPRCGDRGGAALRPAEDRPRFVCGGAPDLSVSRTPDRRGARQRGCDPGDPHDRTVHPDPGQLAQLQGGSHIVFDAVSVADAIAAPRAGAETLRREIQREPVVRTEFAPDFLLTFNLVNGVVDALA